MKKVFVMFALMLVFSSVLVAAQSYQGNNLGDNLGYGMEQLMDTVEAMFGPLFSNILGGEGDYLFERIMFLFVLIAIIYIVVSRAELFKKNKMVVWVITITISLLATRFMTETSLIQTMLLPYSVLGVTITAVLPILIYFFFVQSFDDSATVRKMLWVFYIVVFIGLWSSRYSEIGPMSWIYMTSAFAALFFLIFDGTIRNAMVRNERKSMNVERKEQHLAKLRGNLAELRSNEGHYDPKIFKKILKEKSKQIDRAERARV